MGNTRIIKGIKFYRSGNVRCKDCKAVYSPLLGLRGVFPKGWRVCPKCGGDHTSRIWVTIPEE